MGIPGTGSTGRQIANNSRIRTTLRHTDLDQISSTEHNLGPHTENRAVPTRPFFSPTLTEHLLTPPAADYSHYLTQSYKATCNPQQSIKSKHNRRTKVPENIEQVYRGTRETSRHIRSPIVSGFQGRFRIAAGFQTNPQQTLSHAKFGHRREAQKKIPQKVPEYCPFQSSQSAEIHVFIFCN